MAILIDGKVVSARVREAVKQDAGRLLERTGIRPGLAVILVGENPASKTYVRNKKKACEEAGIYSAVYELPESTKEHELLELINTLSEEKAVHGILVQMPLPPHISESRVIEAIPPHKDVDAFHPINVGKLMLGSQSFQPCTPAGVMELLAAYDIDPQGRHCVIIGRSNIVGKPQAMLMLQKNATVTICHSRTVQLAEITRKADILVVAIGRPGFVTADMVKEGAIVIDIGINRLESGKLAGDVCFEETAKKASYITPVPGGVGPMTIAMLLRNTVTAARIAAGEIKF